MHQDYDVSSRLTGLKVDNADYAKDVVYNAASQTTSLKVGADGANQITESYTYADTTGLLTNQKVQRGATSLMDLSYDYLRTGTTSGRTGQLTKILNNLNHSRDRGYIYDALGRLTTATGGQPASWTQQYVYDRYGNRTSVTATGTTGGTSLSPPTNLTATTAASGNSITLNWDASPGAHHYQIERRSAGNPAFQPIGTSMSPSYTDSPLTTGAAFVYRVRAADAQNNLSGSSNARLGVAKTFTDPTLVSGVTSVKAAHVTELRDAINAVRTLAGLPQSSWSAGVAFGQTIFAVQVEELRTALTPALQALSLTVPVFTDAQLFGVIIKKLHIEELRAGVNASGPGDSGGGSSPIPVDGLASASYNQATNRINSAGWEYDAAGNQTRVLRSDGAWQRYVYDAAGRLVKVQNDSGVTQIIHTYGASNHRLIEQIGDENSNQRTYYAWAGDSVIAEYEETASAPTTPRWVKSYVYLGARLLATIAPSGASERVEYHHPDRLGTRLVTNNQDTSSFEQVSLPFGTALDAESSGATRRRFTSYDRSTVSGLDYAVNRHYDPLQGRFTQVDPIGMASTSLGNPQTLNLFAYCANDPINHTDPSGLGFFSFLGKIFGAIGKALHFIAKVLAVVAAVAAVVFLAWGMPYVALAFGIFSGLLFASAYGPPIVGKLLNAVGAAARPVTVAGTPPINPRGGSGVGPISSFLQNCVLVTRPRAVRSTNLVVKPGGGVQGGVVAGGRSFGLTIFGENFRAGAQVDLRLNGDVFTTVEVERIGSKVLKLSVPARVFQESGAMRVVVRNPGGGESESRELAVRAPEITAFAQRKVFAGSTGVRIDILGQNFRRRARVYAGNARIDNKHVRFRSNSHLVVTLKGDLNKLIEKPDTLKFQVVNSNNADGVPSADKGLRVVGPEITSALLLPVKNDASKLSIVIEGANFRRGATVEFFKIGMENAPVIQQKPATLTRDRLIVVVSAKKLERMGSFGVRVVDTGGVASHLVRTRFDATTSAND